ncbi:ATP-binding protein [Glaciecola sp. 1036]|uniref:ATP-binding protein n=1 Tax=Alteromonadaceae TaxID=72275 RepID=UPI003D078477
MTRLFLSLYLFIAISLVVLTAGLNNMFFSETENLTQEQQAWINTVQALVNDIQNLTSILDNAGIQYQISPLSDVVLAESVDQTLQQDKVIWGYEDNLWQIYVMTSSQQLIQISFAQSEANAVWWLYTSLFFILLGILIAIWIYPLWRDMNKLVKATQIIHQDGSFAVPILPTSSPVKPVADALRHLEDKVTLLLANQRELAGAVTHEFKTPIARLKFALNSDADLSAKDVEKAKKDVDELDALIQEMLDFTKLSNQQVDLHMEEIPVDELCLQRIEHFSHLAPKAIKISLKTESFNLVADGYLVSRALDNLLSNAIRYAKTTILVSAEKTDSHCRIQVEDDGLGLSEEQMNKVFEPFYRADEARHRDFGGTGLGLATVKRIVTWHQGKVDVSKSQFGGAKFSLEFPLTD